MSRIDNTFPKYVKLKLDPLNPPNDMWERGTRKCVQCGLHWPNYSVFNPSPCCGNITSITDSAPEIPWSEAVKKLLQARFERYYAEWNGDVTDEAILWDESIEIPSFQIDEKKLEDGMAEINRLIGEPEPTSTEI